MAYSVILSVGLINCRFTLGFPSLFATVHFRTNRFVTPSYTRFDNVDVASWFNLSMNFRTSSFYRVAPERSRCCSSPSPLVRAYRLSRRVNTELNSNLASLLANSSPSSPLSPSLSFSLSALYLFIHLSLFRLLLSASLRVSGLSAELRERRDRLSREKRPYISRWRL